MGNVALTGVGVTFPVIMLISAFSALVAMGGAPLAAIHLGEGNRHKAEELLGNSFSLLILFGLMIMGVLHFFSRDILLLFGASERTIVYSMDYMNVYQKGTVFVMLTLGMTAYITAMGFTRVSMTSTIIGAVLNIVLDPIFIFVLDKGVAGAAMATVISQAVSCGFVLYFVLWGKSTLRLHRENLIPRWHIFSEALALGASPAIMQGTESLLAVSFNVALRGFGGDMEVGAMTILMSIMQMMILPISGLTQGAQPIISYNFGAGNEERVKEGVGKLVKSTVIYSLIFWLLIMVFPGFFTTLFTDNVELSRLAAVRLRQFMMASFALGVQISFQQAFVALGQSRISIVLALLRKIILLIPLIHILPIFFLDKTLAVYLAEPVSDIIAASITSTVFLKRFPKIMADRKKRPVIIYEDS